MKTTTMIQEEHQKAEDIVIEILRDVGEPKSTRELVALAHEREHRFSSDTVRSAVWSLVAEERIEFTVDHRLILRL